MAAVKMPTGENDSFRDLWILQPAAVVSACCWFSGSAGGQTADKAIPPCHAWTEAAASGPRQAQPALNIPKSHRLLVGPDNPLPRCQADSLPGTESSCQAKPAGTNSASHREPPPCLLLPGPPCGYNHPLIFMHAQRDQLKSDIPSARSLSIKHILICTLTCHSPSI
ncbi:hypothetical protein NQZ68_020589 [Dissostichus eleginoides]|nr:hypothetical protein NQZ68_020589 [Dissostichus eleginoides]